MGGYLGQKTPPLTTSLHSEAQYCSLKSNFYVNDTVQITAEIKDNNAINKSVSVIWSNNAFIEKIDPFVIDPSGQFPYAPWSRLVVPYDSKFAASDSYRKSGIFYYTPKQYEDNELGGYVFDHVVLFRHVRKQGDEIKTQSYTTNYGLPGTIRYTEEKGYQMLVVKHPGKDDEKYVVIVKKRWGRIPN